MSHDAYDYERHSQIAGPLAEPPADGPYRVQFRRLDGSRPIRSTLLVLIALLFVGGFLTWLMLPAHWPRAGDDLLVNIASIVVTATTGIIGWFAFLNVATLCRATLLARDPVPVRPQPGQRVAFLTTIVPEAESLELVRPTLEAALRIRHDGQLDVWLLDEGDDPDVRRMCAELGVNHFSRRGVKHWNQPKGPHRARSKHGNYNAWLEAHGERYDLMLGVDPDHVPLPNFAERLLGYFRDPNVGFVVGPQVYGNYDGFVVRSAESQQFLFHSLLQRAGNGSRTPMLVGTNNALRVSALRQIGGFQDSITEDMATSLIFHTTRNPETSKRWTSVYTPDVVSVGEGPASFTDYFSQQDRWSRGTDEVLVRRFWRTAHRLGPRAMLHYLLLTAYYPTAAIAWILGAVNAILYFALGAGGVVVPAHLWLMLYVDAAALQIGLYFFNRRHNVSPHEKKGSAGVAGMLISALSAPIYAASLAAVALRRSRGFVTTPKGDASTRDTLITFRKHVLWTLVFGVPLLFSFVLGHHHFSMRAWSVASLVVCLLPVAIWRVELARERRAERREESMAEAERGEEPAEEPERGEEPAEPAQPVRRERLRPVPDVPLEPVLEEPVEPVLEEPVEPVRDEPVEPLREEPVEPLRDEPLQPVASERRKRHEVVRFERRGLTRDGHGAGERTTTGPVRELRQGRRKSHMIVRFDSPQDHEFGEHSELEQAWQVFDQAEA